MSISTRIVGPIAIVTIDNPPVNAASYAVRQGLVDAVMQTEGNPDIAGVVLTCAGRTFVAGADVREFNQPPKEPHLPDVVAALETTTKPWVAAIHGTALGGGLEIAMGCHYRIAAHGAKCGLPEVNLGLIPGAGGTVRLPRLTGPVAALDMIAKGKPISASKALEIGLIDQVTEHDLLETALDFLRARLETPLPLATINRQIPEFDVDELTKAIAGIKGRSRGQNSPIAACDALLNATKLSAKEALAAERTMFLDLKQDPQSKALRHVFFAERSAGKIDAIKDVKAPELNAIGVIGGGTMGAGIAVACLLSGLGVTMIERDAKSLETGQERVADMLSKSRARGLITAENHAAISARFSGSTDYDALSDADLVIEAVFEDLEVKRDVFRALDKSTKTTAVLASNTSYLDIALIADVVADPTRVIGLHFFSPAHIMKLLELVIPTGASPLAIATGAALGKRLRKIVVPSGVCDGFIGNRIMSAYRQACSNMIEDGALPAQVDAAMRGYGFPMGIFEMQDLAGNDISWAMRKRQAPFRDPNVRYVEIADKLCELGRFGRKTGFGWYKYVDGKPVVDPDVTALIMAESTRNGITRRAFTDDEIMAEILSIMQTEGEKILDEGIAAKASDIDVVMINGFSFPRWRGGPMFLRP